jgi:predicted phage terminase large subunit-like protein
VTALVSPEALSAERARRRLRLFIEQAWPVVEPASPFVAGWHIDAIADHLEAVTAGEIRALVINMPPRHMKSLTVSVFWPVWEWATNPERRWLFASYALSLSIRDSLKCRRLIESPWFQERWADRFQLTSDQNVKARFDNNHTGYRIATSVGGAATGEGGDRIVVDDPHNVQEAESEAVRSATLTWWDEVMSTRLNDPKTGAKVIVMQRCHERDLSGHVLEQGGYQHLCLPAEFDGRRTVTSIGWSDPRRQQGELLWPARYGRPELDALKRALGSYGTAGQLEQRPAPRGGGLFQRQWFPIVTALPASGLEWCRFWDVAGTEHGGDFTVGTKVARSRDGVYYVVDVQRGQWSAGEVEQRMVQAATMDGPHVRIREEREPGSSGKAVIATRTKTLAGYDYRGVPATGQKEIRWQPFAAQAEAGNVKLLKGGWVDDWLRELEVVPFAEHDDQADSAAGAFNDLTIGTVDGYGFLQYASDFVGEARAKEQAEEQGHAPAPVEELTAARGGKVTVHGGPPVVPVEEEKNPWLE